jgi:hypothetical protein
MNEPDPETAEAWLAAAKDAERRGELLEAYDIAKRGLAAYPDSLWLKHRAVLVLARANATEQAARRFRDYGLGAEPAEDIAALEARIAKDRALAVAGDERRRRAQRSADLYRAIFDRTGSYYPGINAATMTLIAGDAQGAAALAREVAAIAAAGRDDPYYRAATVAEAALLQDNADKARAAVAEAMAAAGGDWAALATTRKQLGLARARQTAVIRRLSAC